jgi:Predicted integral membrane protein (DUF2269)
VDWYDWLLFLHVAAAFVLVTGVVLAVAVLLEARREGGGSFLLRRVSPLAELLWNVGGITVLVFGVWLAIHGTPQDYDILDGWIVAAIVLWLIASGAGGPIVKAYREARSRVGSAGPDNATLAVASRRVLLLHAVLVVATAALLFVMIYKPGAG